MPKPSTSSSSTAVFGHRFLLLTIAAFSAMVMPADVVADKIDVINAKHTAIEQTKLTVQRISTMLDTPSEHRTLQTATETVRYGLSWAIATVGCSNNFDASLSANCGTSGVIALEQTTSLGNTITSCSVLDSNTINCAGTNGLGMPDFDGLVLNSGLIFSCIGSNVSDVRATAVATITNATCTDSNSTISHGAGLLVENNDNGNVRITSSCASGVEVDDLVCVDVVECSAPFGSTCTTPGDTVTTIQDLPIPGFGTSGAMGLGMVGTFGVGFMSVLAMMTFGMTTAFFG